MSPVLVLSILDCRVRALESRVSNECNVAFERYCSSTDTPDDILMQLFEEVDNQQSIEVDPAPTLPNVGENVEMESEVPAESEANVNTDTYGYVLAIDNLDMNVRHSFQRVDRTTQSMHLCHAFAALNRINTSGLEDGSM